MGAVVAEHRGHIDPRHPDDADCVVAAGKGTVGNDVVRHDWIKASDGKFVALGV